MPRTAERHGPATASDYEDEVLASLRPRLDAIVARLAAAGAPLPDPHELAETMAAAVPGATALSEYDRLIGPFYSSAGAMRVLGIPTKQALADRRRRGTLLAARTSEGVWVYPSFQFDLGARSVRSSLVPVLAALKPAPRWGAALWLTTEHEELGGRTPIAAASGSARDRELVCRLAAQYAQAIAA